MSVRFRNVEVDATSPVEGWPYEALTTAVERGLIGDWVRITAAIDREPWGDVARQIEQYLAYENPYGVGDLLARAIVRARRQAEQRERESVALEITRLIERSGLSMASLASLLGTSRSRLSTYRSGGVVPSATFMVRLRGVVEEKSPTSGAASPDLGRSSHADRTGQ